MIAHTGRLPRLPWTIVTAIGIGCLCAWSQEPADAPRQMFGNSLFQTLERGGAVMYVILAASVIGLGFLFEAAFRTRRGAILPGRLRDRLSSHTGGAAVDEIVNDGRDTAIRRILQAGRYWRHGTREEIEGAIEEAVDEELYTLRRSVRPVGILANTAPLLGLLGTVVGIVEAFDVVAQQGALGDPAALAGGISKALLTTVFGLIVAIPLLLSYHYYMGRIEALLRKCEALAKENLILPPQQETIVQAPSATAKATETAADKADSTPAMG